MAQTEERPPGWPIQAFCVRQGCGHISSWHKLDDALDLDPTDEDTPYRCVGYDSLAPGPPPPGGRACDCPNMVRSRENLDALEADINSALKAISAASALRRSQGRMI